MLVQCLHHVSQYLQQRLTISHILCCQLQALQHFAYAVKAHVACPGLVMVLAWGSDVCSTAYECTSLHAVDCISLLAMNFEFSIQMSCGWLAWSHDLAVQPN